MFEYIPDNPETWAFQKLPDIPTGFQESLNRIAGLNRHNQPNLRAVKGNEILSDRSVEKILKYHTGWTPPKQTGFEYFENGVAKFTEKAEDAPANAILLPVIVQKPLGLLRYVIERWTSPEELENANRFQQQYGQGDLEPTLRKFPRQGVYDCYFIVERQNGSFRKLDNAVLDHLKSRWNFDKKATREKERLYADAQTTARIRKDIELDERLDAAMAGDLTLPREETERREEYWAKQHNYKADEGVSSSIYVTTYDK